MTTILQAVILARLLGPEGKGEFTEIILWPTLIANLAMFGLYTGIVRVSAKQNHYERYDVTRSALYCGLITGVVGAIACFIVNSYYFSASDYLLIAQVYCVYALIYSVNRSLSAIHNGRGNLGIFSIASSILNPVFFIIVGILALFHYLTVGTAVIALLVANLSSCLFMYSKKDKVVAERLYPCGRLMSYSVRFSPSDFSEPLYAYYDKAIIAILLTPYSLGLYTIAYSSAGLIGFVSNSFSIKIFSDVAQGKRTDVYETIRRNFLIMAISAMVLAVVLPVVIPMFFGEEFKPSIVPALLLIPVCVLQGQSLIMERAILAKGYPYEGLKAKVISVVIFAAGSVTLYLLSFANLITISILMGGAQCFYLGFLHRRLKKIFPGGTIIPRKSDMSDLWSNIKSSLTE